MADDGFEPYHVPHQTRRDKLRVNTADTLSSAAAFVPPFYDPSDLIRQEDAMNLMQGFNSTHIYVDPQIPQNINPSFIHEINGASVYSVPYRGGVHDVNSNTAATVTTTGQSLSLTLSSHHNNLPLQQRHDNGGVSASIELSKSTVPLGPFTGYASVLKSSRFLKPAQQLLEEICDVGRGFYADKTGSDSSLLDPPLLGDNGVVDDSISCSGASDQTRKKSRLLSMLDEVYKRYKQYYLQMQSTVAAFESIAGLSSAGPFVNLAVKAMLKHFRYLKNAITDQLQFNKSHGKTNSDRDEALRLGNPGRVAPYGQRPFPMNDQPVWRPQRGLPERAVTVLRAWLFEHFLHPYPTDTDKLMLAKQTGLSRNQVSNWFINARVRLWKPMVEEIHMLETRQNQKSSQHQQTTPNRVNDHLPTSCSLESENIQRAGDDFPLKHIKDRHEPSRRMKLPYDNLLQINPQLDVGLGNAGGNVSLTLGLHLNGVGLSDSYPINAARRFGLDPQGDGYPVSGFSAQNQQFGRDVIGGQLMHDFVG